jgi:hypothetical protein
MKTTDFTPGMTVLDFDKSLAGEIKEVWVLTSAHGYMPMSRHLISDYGPIKGNREALQTEEGFLQIRKDAFLGLGGQDSYIPLSAIQKIRSEQALAAEPLDLAMGATLVESVEAKRVA